MSLHRFLELFTLFTGVLRNADINLVQFRNKNVNKNTILEAPGVLQTVLWTKKDDIIEPKTFTIIS